MNSSYTEKEFTQLYKFTQLHEVAILSEKSCLLAAIQLQNEKLLAMEREENILLSLYLRGSGGLNKVLQGQWSRPT